MPSTLEPLPAPTVGQALQLGLSSTCPPDHRPLCVQVRVLKQPLNLVPGDWEMPAQELGHLAQGQPQATPYTEEKWRLRKAMEGGPSVGDCLSRFSPQPQVFLLRGPS